MPPLFLPDGFMTREHDRVINALIKQDGDHCSLCRVGFTHNTRTHYGIVRGTAAVVGDCCRAKLVQTLGVGLYLAKDRGGVLAAGIRGKPCTSSEAARAVEWLQRRVDYVDRGTAAATKQTGLPKVAVNYWPTPWQEDDRKWFEENPTRSHRLRPCSLGEEESFEGVKTEPPPGYEMQVIVRQLEPGCRMRFPFFRNTAVPLLDSEPFLHAVFDLHIDKQKKNDMTPVTTKSVAELAMQYATSFETRE